MAATMMFLSPATRRISPGSLVTTVIWPSDADWMTAPMCESATETPIRSRMRAAVLALTVSTGQSAIRRRFGKTHTGEVRSQPASALGFNWGGNVRLAQIEDQSRQRMEFHAFPSLRVDHGSGRRRWLRRLPLVVKTPPHASRTEQEWQMSR